LQKRTDSQKYFLLFNFRQLFSDVNTLDDNISFLFKNKNTHLIKCPKYKNFWCIIDLVLHFSKIYKHMTQHTKLLLQQRSLSHENYVYEFGYYDVDIFSLI